jgi:hypothetical protein
MNKDPILAMIAEHRCIGKALREVSQHLKHPDDNPLEEPYLDATIRLYKTTPTTIAGVATLLDYEIKRRDGICGSGGGYYGHPKLFLKSIREGAESRHQLAPCPPAAPTPPCPPAAPTPLSTLMIADKGL